MADITSLKKLRDLAEFDNKRHARDVLDWAIAELEARPAPPSTTDHAALIAEASDWADNADMDEGAADVIDRLIAALKTKAPSPPSADVGELLARLDARLRQPLDHENLTKAEIDLLHDVRAALSTTSDTVAVPRGDLGWLLDATGDSDARPDPECNAFRRLRAALGEGE